MIILLKPNITNEQKNLLTKALNGISIPFEEVKIDKTTAITFADSEQNKIHFDFLNFEGVQKVIVQTPEFLKTSRKLKPDASSVSVGQYEFTDKNFLIIAGPCSIEM